MKRLMLKPTARRRLALKDLRSEELETAPQQAIYDGGGDSLLQTA